MSAGNILELLIILVIVIGIGAAIWRGGAKNPVGTGSLDKKLATVGSQLAGVTSKVGEIEERLNTFEEAVASVADIKRLEKAIDKVAKVLPDIEARQRALSDKLGERAEASAAVAARVEHIDKQVGLIYSVLVPKGMEK
jgi:chromosome segregation ATPase